jgi:broad specificity phosphatase PhoE
MTIKTVAFALGLATLLALPALAADIYLVRHAEKQIDAPEDPNLTETGRLRAANLAVMLKSAGIDRVLTTEFKRTRETAAPVAEVAGVEMEIYDPTGLDALAARLLESKDNALVVGHSNTTPELVDLLGGEGGPPIVEAWEYDRLYLLQTNNGKVTRTILLHLPPGTEAPPGN